MVLTRKFEVGLSELSRKETDNLQLLLSVLLCKNWSFEFYLSIYLFTYSFFWLCWVFIVTCGGFSSCRAQVLEYTGSVIALCRLLFAVASLVAEHGL